HGLAAVDDADGPADRREVFLARIDAEAVAHGAEEVGDADGTVDDVVAGGVGAADDLAAANAPARQGDAERPREMVAARVGVDARRPPELAHAEYQRARKPAALTQL